LMGAVFQSRLRFLVSEQPLRFRFQAAANGGFGSANCDNRRCCRSRSRRPEIRRPTPLQTAFFAKSTFGPRSHPKVRPHAFVDAAVIEKRWAPVIAGGFNAKTRRIRALTHHENTASWRCDAPQPVCGRSRGNRAARRLVRKASQKEAAPIFLYERGIKKPLGR